MKIRIINMFEPVVPLFRDVIPMLSKQGNAVEVIISRVEYRSVRTRLERCLREDKVVVSRVPDLSFKSEMTVTKLLRMLTFVVMTAVVTAFGKGADINVFLTQPPFFFLWGGVLQALRRERLYVLVMDLYPNVAIQAGVLKGNRMLAKGLFTVTKFVLRRADLVIAIGRCMREKLESIGVEKERIRVIHNWSDERNIYPVKPWKNMMRCRLGLDRSFVVLYSGNMGVSHFFDDLIKVAQRLKEKRQLFFVLVGDGRRREEISLARSKFDLQNVILLPFQAEAVLAETMSLGDVHYISLRPGFEGLEVPSKAYAALASGRPIIYQGSTMGEISRMVSEEGVGTVVTPGDVGGLERAILRYYEEPAVCAEQGKKCLELTHTRFGRKAALEAYSRIFEDRVIGARGCID